MYFVLYFRTYSSERNGSENGSYPDEITLFLVDEDKNLSVDVIPNRDDVHKEDNCLPIVVELHWNGNDDEYIPECVYKQINGEIDDYNCFVLEYDAERVRCGCTQFGTYSVRAIYGNTPGFYINSYTAVWAIVLFLFLSSVLIFNRRLDKRFDDEPMIAKEVYMPLLSLFFDQFAS